MQLSLFFLHPTMPAKMPDTFSISPVIYSTQDKSINYLIEPAVQSCPGGYWIDCLTSDVSFLWWRLCSWLTPMPAFQPDIPLQPAIIYDKILVFSLSPFHPSQTPNLDESFSILTWYSSLPRNNVWGCCSGSPISTKSQLLLPQLTPTCFSTKLPSKNARHIILNSFQKDSRPPFSCLMDCNGSLVKLGSLPTWPEPALHLFTQSLNLSSLEQTPTLWPEALVLYPCPLGITQHFLSPIWDSLLSELWIFE